MDFALRDIYTAFGMESSFGTDLSASSLNPLAWNEKYRGPFQMSRDVQKRYGLKGLDVFDADKSAKVYINETNRLMKNNESWEAWEIDKRADDLGIDRGMLRYLVWQQGRKGAIDIITAASHDSDGNYSSTVYKGKVAGVTSGTLGKEVRRNMANNVGGLNPDNMSGKEYAQAYLTRLYEKWTERKMESYDKFPESPIEAVMNQGGKF